MRVLLCLPDFYPSSAVKAIRWSESSRQLAESGYSFVVAVPAPRGPRPDSRAHPPWIDRMVYLEDPFGYTLRERLGRRARRAIGYVPDRSIDYWRSHAETIHSVASAEAVDWLVTSSPRHSIHSVGLTGEWHRIAWLADFRDPLIGDQRYDSRRSGQHERLLQYDQQVHEHADTVVHAIPGAARAARSRYPDLAEKILCVTNGAPLADVHLAAPAVLGQSTPLRVITAGKYGADELEALVRSLDRLGRRYSVDIFGPTAPSGWTTPQNGSCRFHGQVPYAEVLGAISEPSLLVALLDRKRSRVSGLSSKLFEYLATGNPVLAINPTAEDQALLGDFERTWLVGLRSESDLRSALEEAINSGPLSHSELATRRIRVSREEKTSQLDQILGRANR